MRLAPFSCFLSDKVLNIFCTDSTKKMYRNCTKCACDTLLLFCQFRCRIGFVRVLQKKCTKVKTKSAFSALSCFAESGVELELYRFYKKLVHALELHYKCVGQLSDCGDVFSRFVDPRRHRFRRGHHWLHLRRCHLKPVGAAIAIISSQCVSCKRSLGKMAFFGIALTTGPSTQIVAVHFYFHPAAVFSSLLFCWRRR